MDDKFWKSEIMQAALDAVEEEEIAKIGDCSNITFSPRFERKMNKLFRDLGIEKIPHPNVDTPVERLKAKVFKKNYK